MTETIHRTWLSHLPGDVPEARAGCADVARFELALGCARLGAEVPGLRPEPAPGEAWTAALHLGQMRSLRRRR